MNKILKRALGVFCLVMCVGDILTISNSKLFGGPENYTVAIILFILFGFGAWRLLFSGKGEVKVDDTKEEQIVLGYRVLVYAVDALLAVILWAFPTVIVHLCGAGDNSTATLIAGAIGLLAFIFACASLPGPKKFRKWLSKNKR